MNHYLINQFFNFMYMKKPSFWGLAALPLLFLAVSCTNEIIESKNDKENRIEFKAAVGKQTLSKATEFTYWSASVTPAFNVRAYPTGNTSTTPLYTFPLEYKGGTDWEYGTPIKQPGYPLSYYAYYPAANVTSVSEHGNSGTFAYTVQGVATQEDLIAAVNPNQLSPSVTLVFNHILTQINFAVQGMTNMKINVTNLKVNSVSNAGTYTYGATSGAMGSWSSLSGGVSYDYTPIAGILPTNGSNGNIVYLGNGGGTYTRDNALMLIPQSFNLATGGNFTFNYEITDLAGTTTLRSGSATAYFGDFNIHTWALGTRYIYLIDFSALFVGGEIKFTVTVNPWVDEPAPNTAQTLYVATTSQEAIEQAIGEHDAKKAANTSLTIFPISLPVAPTVAIELEKFGTNFVMGDAIRIHCVTNAGALFIALEASVTDWDISVSGDVVILSKK